MKAEEETTFSLHKKKGINAERKEAKAEKEEAEKYQKLTEELADAKLELQLCKLFHTEEEIKAIQSELKVHMQDLQKMNGKKDKVDEQLKKKKSEQGKVAREIAIKEKSVTEKETDLNKKRPMYLKAKQTTQHQSKKLDDSKKALAKTKKNAEKQQQEICELERELDEVNEMSGKYDEELAKEAQGQSVDLMDSQMSEYNKLKEKAGKKAAAVQSQLDKINREQKSDKESMLQSTQRRNDLQSRQRELEEQKVQYEQRVSACDDYVKSNVEKMEALKNEYQTLSKSVKVANQRHMELNTLLEETQKQLSEAKADKTEDTRSKKKAELIDNLKRLFPGVYGRLADLCEPVHKRYAVAVTKVLGKNMEAIVVDTEKTGRDCLQYMKEQMVSRETYLPLDTLKVKNTNESYRQIGGTAKLVIDVIKYDPACIKRALMFACGNAIVCDTMDEARKVAFSSGERKKTVSIDGTMFEKSGVMCGGLADIQKKAKRWDTKQIDQLKKKREDYMAEIKELNQERRKESLMPDLKSQINGLESRLKYTKRDKENMESQSLAFNARELDIITHKLKEIEPDIERLTKAIDKREGDIKKVQAKKNVVEDEVFTEFCKQIGVKNIREYEEKQLLAQQEKTQKRLEFEKQKGRLASQLEYVKSHDHQHQYKKLEKSIKKIEDEIHKLKDAEKQQLKDIDKDTDELDKLRLEVQALKSETEAKENEMKEIRKQVASHEKDVAVLQKKLSGKERQLDEKYNDKQGVLKQCQMDDIKIPLLKGSLAGIEENTIQSSQDEPEADGGGSARKRARIDDNVVVVDFEKLDEKLRDIDEPDQLKSTLTELNTKVNKLDTTLSRISAPNMKAYSKLDDVQNRLRETSNDFENTRKYARKTKMEFEAIQKERYDKFMDAFEHVSQKIDDIYKELSMNPSAQAFLGAENAEEPYLEGIGYNCVAPGKRFRPMDNLSGGEKTVAALALLFAIHSYQPSPFFVLDEVDAALDNTNINRVANYIKNETTRNFQCIVISLKEEFYTKADSVVGVTADPDSECTTTRTFTLDLRQYPE